MSNELPTSRTPDKPSEETQNEMIDRMSREQIKRGILTEKDIANWRSYPKDLFPKLLKLNEKRANIIDRLKSIMTSIGDIELDSVKKYNPHNAIKFFKRKYHEIIEANSNAKKILDDENITPDNNEKSNTEEV